jgi:CHASE3 domain sensor protein
MKDLEIAVAAVAAVEPKLVEAKTLVAKANEVVVAKQAAMKPVAEKMAQAKQTADQARAVLNQMQQEVDAFRQPAKSA